MDLVFSSDPEVVSNVDISEPLGSSDPNMILCDLKPPNSVTYKTAKKSRNYHKANWELRVFQENLAMVDWEEIFSSGETETLWTKFSQSISQLIDFTVPIRVNKSKLQNLFGKL